MKDLTSKINESKNKFYPQDYYNMEDENDVIDAILDALQYTGIYKSFGESIENDLDPHIFSDENFLEAFGERLSKAVNDYYDENY